MAAFKKPITKTDQLSNEHAELRGALKYSHRELKNDNLRTHNELAELRGAMRYSHKTTNENIDGWGRVTVETIYEGFEHLVGFMTSKTNSLLRAIYGSQVISIIAMIIFFVVLFLISPKLISLGSVTTTSSGWDTEWDGMKYPIFCWLIRIAMSSLVYYLINSFGNTIIGFFVNGKGGKK